MDYLNNLITIAWSLRWISVFVAALVAGGWIADVLNDRRQLRRENDELAAEVDRLADTVTRLRTALAIVDQAQRARRRPIIAGRVVS